MVVVHRSHERRRRTGWLRISVRACRGSHSSPYGVTAADPGRSWMTYGDPPSMSRHDRRERAAAFATAWPPDPRAAGSGSWAGEARRRRGRGAGGEEGSAGPAFSAAAPERRSLLMSAFFLRRTRHAGSASCGSGPGALTRAELHT
jgi:hypothetical protein